MRGIGTSGIMAALLIGAGAFAGVEGTPFEELSAEVDQRFVQATGNRQKRPLRAVIKVLRRVDRGLKRDLRSAGRINGKLGRAFPTDATMDGLLDGMVEGLASVVSSRLFAAEDNLPTVEDFAQRQRAQDLLERGREHEAAAGAAQDRKQRLRAMKRAARKAIAAEKAIAFTPPEVIVPTGDPIPAVIGRVDYTINGQTRATVAVDASVREDRSEFHLSVTATPGTQQLTEIRLDWSFRAFAFNAVTQVGSGQGMATAALQRGSTVYDQNTSGQIHITAMKLAGSSGAQTMTGTYRVSASSAGGQQLTVTGTFDIKDMPYIRDD